MPKRSDPEGAITAARTLVESVCKYILDAKGVTYPKAADLPALYNLAAGELHLAPKQHAEQIARQVLGNCQAVVGGVAAMRNELGDARGTAV